MAKAKDRDPVRPSDEASRAREEAIEANKEAEGHKERAVEKLAESAAEVTRLVGHRRANQFAKLFREAFERAGVRSPGG